MNEKGFRLDFFIAIAAVVISAITAAALIYQTRVIGDQFAATIWPYLSVGETYDVNGETIEVINDGVGPALVRSAQLTVDGRVVPAWNDYLKALARDPTLRAIFLRTQAAVLAGQGRQRDEDELDRAVVDPSTRRIANVAENLAAFQSAFGAIVKHSLTLDFCYCSLNGSCWTLHASPGQISSRSSARFALRERGGYPVECGCDHRSH